MDRDDTEDDNDAHWDAQQQLEQQMLEADPGYAEFVLAIARSNSTQLGQN